jgi:hypothetical protein
MRKENEKRKEKKRKELIEPGKETEMKNPPYTS